MTTNKSSSAWNVTRRTALAGALGTAALAAARPAIGQQGQGARQPNILYIMADDMGYADLSCYGRRDYETPVLDGLARQGMRFTHAYANSAVCTATRVGLITGRYQYRLPIGLQEPLGQDDVGLPPEHPTIPSLMRAQGYHTALIGKWHLGSFPKYDPLKSGYDEFWGNRGGGVDYFTHKAGGRKDLWDGDVQIEESGYYTDLLADRTIEFLDQRQQQAPDTPWFVSLHFTAPHWPWEGPEDERESARLDAQQKVRGGLGIDHFDGGNLATYAEIVRSLDSNIGRILERLTALGLDENTVVVFTSDNGGERFSDVWPFTGRKTELLEGGLRIPAIVRWPGLTTPLSESEVPIMSMDWLPTFVAAAGGAPDPAYPTDGMDIRPVLTGHALPDRPLFWRFNNKSQKAVRHGQWKYLSIGGNEFLFDVVADPLERGNLKELQPEIFADLKARFEAWNGGMLYDPAVPSYGFSPEHLADHFGIDS
ncbi:sulfatase-like hydrolase/transferase [Croceibacterium xixiisoli]|uniref:sulfatase-like hydrolase/transferase n=1 Tax=Croceibacterium xixiisoli TaxID=1476466 RepID=UPI002E25D2DF|nr:sulfatase-like hydrolase/transferase [Croceibacterium xixiisoli]